MINRPRCALLCGAVFAATCFVLASCAIADTAEPKEETAQLATEAKVQRYGAVIGVKPEKLEYYKKLHANTWPGIVKAVQDAGIGNVTIFLTKMDDGKYYLFHYYEYTGSDFEGDMKRLGENPEVKRWWKETDPCQEPLESRKEGEWWKLMEPIHRIE